jgi:hypothetical protein
VCVAGVHGALNVPEVGFCFVDPVTRVLLGAGPAGAEVGEPGHKGVDYDGGCAGCVGLWGRVSEIERAIWVDLPSSIGGFFRCGGRCSGTMSELR